MKLLDTQLNNYAMISIQDIITFLKPIEVIGSKESFVSNAIQLDVSNERRDVVMWASSKNKLKMLEVKVGLILCSEINRSEANPNCTYILCDNPRLNFQKVLARFFMPKRQVGISSTAIVDESSIIGSNIFIGHNVVIEENCHLGDNTIINHNTVVKKDTIIGNDVVIGSNCVIGGVGFGYEKDEFGVYVFMPHIGNVIIHDNVDIGNNTCIDRAVMGSTILGRNVKVDNLVHIAHGVVIGENSLIIANAMIAGSVTIGENCWIAPSASILNKKKIGNNVTVGMSSLVLKDVGDNLIVTGNPAEDLKEVIRKKKLLEDKVYKDN
ncbi:DapH/DapD/GlmU-related protein [Flavobacterium maritimum]|uniref:DapH/DapD/GlmU-related protein n=1 Tax=Flavobacterium maritimum TaxID=3149042 RepID=UPI0032B563A9